MELESESESVSLNCIQFNLSCYVWYDGGKSSFVTQWAIASKLSSAQGIGRSFARSLTRAPMQTQKPLHKSNYSIVDGTLLCYIVKYILWYFLCSIYVDETTLSSSSSSSTTKTAKNIEWIEKGSKVGSTLFYIKQPHFLPFFPKRKNLLTDSIS